MNRFVLKNIFINIYISLFFKYFYKNKGSKLYYGDRVIVLNDFFHHHRGESTDRRPMRTTDDMEHGFEKRVVLGLREHISGRFI